MQTRHGPAAQLEPLRVRSEGRLDTLEETEHAVELQRVLMRHGSGSRRWPDGRDQVVSTSCFARGVTAHIAMGVMPPEAARREVVASCSSNHSFSSTPPA